MAGKKLNTFEIIMDLNSDHMEKEEREMIKMKIKQKNDKMIKNNKILTMTDDNDERDQDGNFKF